MKRHYEFVKEQTDAAAVFYGTFETNIFLFLYEQLNHKKLSAAIHMESTTSANFEK